MRIGGTLSIPLSRPRSTTRTTLCALRTRQQNADFAAKSALRSAHFASSSEDPVPTWYQRAQCALVSTILSAIPTVRHLLRSHWGREQGSQKVILYSSILVSWSQRWRIAVRSRYEDYCHSFFCCCSVLIVHTRYCYFWSLHSSLVMLPRPPQFLESC